MSKARRCILGLIICIFLAACAKPAAGDINIDYGQIKGDFSGMKPETAKAYLAVVDDLSAHLGFDEAEASEGEYLHGVLSATGTATGRRNCAFCSKRVRGTPAAGTEHRLTDGMLRRFISILFKTGRLCALRSVTSISQQPAKRLLLPHW